MVVLTASELFSSQGPPLTVREQHADAPSGPVIAEAVKVIFGISGWARVSSFGDSVTLNTGTILVVPAEMACSGFPFGHARTITLYLNPEYLTDQVRWLPNAHPLVHHLHQALDGDTGLQSLQLAATSTQDLAPLLMQLARPPNNDSGFFTLLAGVAEVFDALGRLAGTRSSCAAIADAVPSREVLTALSLLRSDLSAPWRIDSLARAVSLSTSQLTRLFRTQVGVSPGAFLNQLRADRMAELLASTHLTVGEAGVSVGWPDPAVASRSFKQRYGLAPSTYANFYRTADRCRSELPSPAR